MDVRLIPSNGLAILFRQRNRDDGRTPALKPNFGASRETSLLHSGPEFNQESRLKYWATRSSARSFARTAHSVACSALLARSAALTHLRVFFSTLDHSALPDFPLLTFRNR